MTIKKEKGGLDKEKNTPKQDLIKSFWIAKRKIQIKAKTEK